MRRYVPNLLSLYRLAAAPPVCLLVVHDHWMAALILLMGGFATDLADGYLARRWDIASPPGSFGKRLDVFGDQTIIIAPVLGMVIASDLGSAGTILLPVWIAIMYNTDWLFQGRLDFANFVFWTLGYVLVAWQAFEHLSLTTWAIFAAITGCFIAGAALTHTELVNQGFKEAFGGD